MDKIVMLQYLTGDYTTISTKYDADLETLHLALQNRHRAQETQDAATEKLATKEAIALFAAQAKGEIDGKNADSRKRQREVFIAHFRQNDADAHGLASTIKEANSTLADVSITIEVVKARLYSYQALSRMIAGLAQALASPD